MTCTFCPDKVWCWVVRSTLRLRRRAESRACRTLRAHSRSNHPDLNCLCSLESDRLHRLATRMPPCLPRKAAPPASP